MIDYQEANDIETIIDTKYGVILYLDIIQQPTVTDVFLAGNSSANKEEIWSNRRETVLELGRQLKSFKPFAHVNDPNVDKYVDKTYLAQINEIDKKPFEMTCWKNKVLGYSKRFCHRKYQKLNSSYISQQTYSTSFEAKECICNSNLCELQDIVEAVNAGLET